jgi:hypothetical protein
MILTLLALNLSLIGPGPLESSRPSAAYQIGHATRRLLLYKG